MRRLSRDQRALRNGLQERAGSSKEETHIDGLAAFTSDEFVVDEETCGVEAV
jgi:hypothetical protein